MSFVERVVGHVRRVQQIAEGGARDKRVVIDYGRHEACLLDLLDLLERSKTTRSAQREDAAGQWLTGRLNWFVEELHWVLLAGAASELDLGQRSSLVDVGVALAVQCPNEGVVTGSWLTPIRLRWLSDRVQELLFDSEEWFDGLVSTTWPRVPRYSTELGLVSELEGRWYVSQAGEILLKLLGRDATKWLLTLETQLAVGPDDAWRVGVDLLAEAQVARELHGYSSDHAGLARLRHAERLSAMEVLVASPDSHGRIVRWSLTETGETVLNGVLKGADDPLGLLARALRADELMAVVEAKTKSPIKTGESVGAITLHARMVAHEVRNALGPIQQAARKLRGEVGRVAADTPVFEHLEAIDRGVSRLHRFVTESVRLIPPESQRLEPFSVLEAIAAARTELAPDGIGSLTIETLPASADPHCHGNRAQFVMAMLNVLRNAQQAAEHEARIAIRVDARDPRQILLSIDDDGPGVPDAVREHIFENGVSYREDGTGHGLASLRAVVEDIGGKVRCTTSELGGARFEIMLPAVEDSP